MSPEGFCPPGPDPAPEARRTQQERGISFSTLCSMGLQPLMLTGLVRDLLIRHFTGPGQVADQGLRHLLWRADERTGILIESIHRFRGALVEKRPAIVVKRNAMQNLVMGLGNDQGTDGQGNRAYSTFWVGSHTLFCIHGTGAGAEVLATEALNYLVKFEPVVIEELGLLRWAVTEYGTISELEEARETFVVPITVGWCYGQTWKLSLEAPKLRKVPLSVLLDGAVFA